MRSPKHIHLDTPVAVRGEFQLDGPWNPPHEFVEHNSRWIGIGHGGMVLWFISVPRAFLLKHSSLALLPGHELSMR